VALALVAGAGATPLHAQARPELRIELPADSLLTRNGPLVRATNMLAGERIQKLLLAGFPARFHFRVELWSEGRFFFDQLQNVAEFDVLARYLPAQRMYDVTHVQYDRAVPLGKYLSVSDAERAIGRPNAAPISARPSTRTQYYQATLLVEVLSEKDLDEVARWLQGDVEPGMTGRANPASIVSRGIRTLATRLLGGEKLEYEATSRPFRTP